MSDNDSPATVDNLLAQMSRGVSVLSGWDAVLNIDEGLVNEIFQAQFAQAAREDWKNITIAFCQVFPNPGGSGRLAAYTGVKLQLAKPALKFLGDNRAFVEVSFKATGRTASATKVVPASFDAGKDADADDPALAWDYAGFTEVDLTGEVPLSALAGSAHDGGERTEFVLDFPAASFNSPAFDRVKDPAELRLQLKSYLQAHGVQYVIGSIRTDLAQQIPQMAPRAFRLGAVTTNRRKNVFQIFIATQNPPRRDLTVGVNEPIPDGYRLSAMFNRTSVGALGTSLTVQAWLFLESNLTFPGRTRLGLGPSFTPYDAVVLGNVEVDASPAPPPGPPVPLPEEERAMLNIQKTLQVTAAGQPAFTVYGDDEDPNAWYVVPKVIWASNPATSLPQFSLVKYNQTGGGVSGFCRFSVQLAIDPQQQAALKAQVPGANTPQFDWISGNAVFTYTVAGKSTSVRAKPSNFGSQTVTFALALPDAASLAAFEDAFSSGSGAGTFGIYYELAANTRLPAVTVVSSFDSTIAYQYQVHNRYRIDTQYHTDTWGHTSSNQVSVYLGSYVTEMLNQTQAGTVEVTPGQGITPTLLQMVQDWSKLQLQKDVEQAVSTALAMTRNPAPEFSMTSVASFRNTFKTSNVVPWYFTVEGTLAPFPGGTWKELRSEVNQQQLEVTLQLQAELAAHGVERVNATLQYGSGPEQTHTFAAGSQDAWFVSLPGQFDGSAFRPGYRYKYDVIYAKPDGDAAAPPPLSTGWLESESPVVNLGLVELGLLAVTFEAANVDWESNGGSGDTAAVREISVSWNWVPGAGGPVLASTLVLTKTQPGGTQTLRSAGPTSNQEYQYSLTFLMSDGTKLHANNLRGTSPYQRINHPLSEVTFNVLPMYPDDARAVILLATFEDEKNDIHLSKRWQAKPTVPAGGGAATLNTDSFGAWTFPAVQANLNMATVVFSGTWVDKGGKQHKIPPTLLVGNNSTLVISDTERPVTAAIDASNVAFVPPQSDGVYRVVALVSYTTDDASATAASDPLANATTVNFSHETPSVLYFTTDPVDIAKTPTFWFQYTYTVTRNGGASTDVKNAWGEPQHTVSTALPVVPGQPPERVQPAVVRAVRPEPLALHAVSRDPRTTALLRRHQEYCNSVEAEVGALLASEGRGAKR